MANQDNLNDENKRIMAEIQYEVPEWAKCLGEDFDPEYFDNEDDDYGVDEDPQNSNYSKEEKMATIYSGYDNGHKKFYHDYVNSLPLLTEAKEKDLTKRIAEGDLEAREEFIELNLLMAYKVARKFKKNMEKKMPPYIADHIYIMELVQQANKGLLEAVDRFDPSKGYKFSTYAGHWMRKEMLQAMDFTVKENEERENLLNSASNIMEKIGANDNKKQVDEAYEGNFNDKEKNEDSSYKYVEKTGANAEKEKGVAEFVYGISDATIKNDPIANKIDDDDDKELQDEIKKRILASISKLPDMERKVIEGLFGINGCTPKTHEELAREMKIRIDGVRYLERRAKLKLAEENKDLADK